MEKPISLTNLSSKRLHLAPIYAVGSVQDLLKIPDGPEVQDLHQWMHVSERQKPKPPTMIEKASVSSAALSAEEKAAFEKRRFIRPTERIKKSEHWKLPAVESSDEDHALLVSLGISEFDFESLIFAWEKTTLESGTIDPIEEPEALEIAVWVAPLVPAEQVVALHAHWVRRWLSNESRPLCRRLWALPPTETQETRQMRSRVARN